MRLVAAGALVTGLAACGSSSPAATTTGASPTATGFEQGDAFPEIALTGMLDRDGDGKFSSDERGPLHPADVLAANPRAELLLVHVAFGWCKYCWEETAQQLKWTRAYAGRFVSTQVLVQDADGKPADVAYLDNWISLNHSAMPTALEPAGLLLKRYGRSATYLLVDVRDGHRVLIVGAGPPAFGAVKEVIAQRLGPIP